MYGIYLKVSPSGISVVKLTHCGQQHVVEEQGYGHDDEHQAIDPRQLTIQDLAAAQDPAARGSSSRY